jgi:CheY-like chemotaxis protein
MFDKLVEHRKPRVLAVDDNRGNLLALEATLGSGYDMLRANSGFEAIELMQADPGIDVVLMDVQMPGLDGFDTAARIKALPGYREIPIIFVSAVHTEDPFIRRGYEAGGVDYFSKPYDPAILRMKVQAYASYRLKDELLRRRERSLREAGELLEVCQRLVVSIEDLPLAAIVTDAHGEVVHVTGEAALIQDQLTEEQRQWVAAAVGRGETSRASVFRVSAPGGGKHTVLMSVFPLRSRDGAVAGALLLSQDVTHARDIEKDFEERVAALGSGDVARGGVRTSQPGPAAL